MKIIAIDPGGTTGVAIYADGEYATMTLPINDVMQQLNDWAMPDVFVVEFFATAGRLSRYGLATIDLVGQIKGYCFAKNIPCVTQSPMSRKAWVLPAEKVLRGRPHVIHETDALAHLLEYQELLSVKTLMSSH